MSRENVSTPPNAPQSIVCPKTGLPLPFKAGLSDGAMQPPKWAASGVQAKIKATDVTRFKNGCGLRCYSFSGNSRLWAGEVGTVERDIFPHTTEAEVKAGACYYGGVPKVAGEGGFWRWVVRFSHGRDFVPGFHGEWSDLVRVMPKRDGA